MPSRSETALPAVEDEINTISGLIISMVRRGYPYILVFGMISNLLNMYVLPGLH